jgi:catechol 2,3-dioxygenase-like lactoylglutathione lyase family enzyme
MTNPSAHHFGVTVSDLDRAVEFYRDVLGLEPIERFGVSGEAFSEAVGVKGASGSFAHLEGGGARIELVEYDPEGETRPRPTVDQPGATHLGLAVDDLDAFHEGLPAAVETVNEPRTTESETRILFVRDPEGNLVEVLEG